MSRIRSIKPEFFTNDELAELPPLTRLFFIGLWTQADREGRMEYRPKRLKMVLMPYDDCDVPEMVQQLEQSEHLLTYEVDGHTYLEVQKFVNHQSPNIKERASTVPAPCQHRAEVILESHLWKGEERKGEERTRERTASLGNLPSCMVSDSLRLSGEHDYTSSQAHILKAVEKKHGIVSPADLGLIGSALSETCHEGCKRLDSDKCCKFALEKIAVAHTVRNAADFIRKDRGSR